MTVQLGNGYKEFYGRNIEQMPLLIAEGLRPMSVATLMQKRLDVLGTPSQDVFWINYFDTGDAIAYAPDGKMKVVLDAEAPRAMTRTSKSSNGALVLPSGAYEKLNATAEFTRKELVPYIGKSLSEAAVRENPVWQALAGGDQALLNAYAFAVFKEAKRVYNYDKNMGVFVTSAQAEPIMRLWFVNELYYVSNANGSSYLFKDFGRFVGVAPEAQKARDTIEARLR